MTAKPMAERTCADCAHRRRGHNCGQPVLAQLAQRFEVVFAPTGWAKECKAFAPRQKVTD